MDNKNQVVCFGEVLWDVFPSEQKPGGAPLNVAVHLTNFGITPSLVSRVGKDLSGQELIHFISSKGVNCQHIQYDNEHPTGVVNVTVEKSGNC
jgi:fructokinase